MAKTTSAKTDGKRSRGRPVAAEVGVGRDGLIAAARQLLATLPPAKITTSLIARQAGADPALVRYYFGDRQSLLLAVVEAMLAERRAAHLPLDAPPAEQLETRIRGTADFARTARSMQRLMIDELADAKSPEIRERIREMNARAVSSYAAMLDSARPDALEAADPLFMFVAVIGMCEFFASAQPMIAPLAPPGVGPDELAERYKAFLVKLVLEGLRPR